MTIPRASDAQKRAIKNLMFSSQNIQYVLDFMLSHGKRYINELSIGEAKTLIGVLVDNGRSYP
jgi:hypothetical protein